MSFKVLSLNLRKSEWKNLKQIKKEIATYQKKNGLEDIKAIGYVHIIRGGIYLALNMLKRNPGLLYKNIMKADIFFTQEDLKDQLKQKG